MTQAIGTSRARGASKLMGIAMVTAALVAWAGAGGASPADSASFDGAGPDTGFTIEAPSEPPGERWTLARAVAAALEGSVDSRAAHARTVQAQGGSLSAWSGILPSLDGNLNYTRTKRNSVFPDASGQPVAFLQDTHVRSAGLEARTNLLSVSSWSEKHRQNLLVRTARESEAEARNGVVYNVKQQYFALVKAERLAQVSRESERLARDEERRAEALYEVGTVARGDVLKARARRAQTQLDRIRAVNQVEIQRSKLKQVIGLRPDTPLAIEAVLDENVVLPDSATAVSTALRSRPELSRAAAAESAARAGLFGARAKRLPEVTGTASVDRGRTKDVEGEDELSFTSTDWFGGARLTLPVFNGFALEGNMKSAKGAVLAAEAERRQREVDVAVEVQQAWLSVREAVERINVAKEGLASAEEDYNFSKGRYELGAGTFLDLLNSEVTLAQSRQSYVEALADAHVAEAALERAVGERRY